MKRTLLAILLVVAAAIPAQARQGFPPASFAQPMQMLRSVDLVILPSVDVEALKAEDDKALAEGTGGPARFAATVPVDLDATRDGTWETLPDGSRTWRLRIVSPRALSLNFGFSRFHLPDGATVHFYPVTAVPEQAGGVPHRQASPAGSAGSISADASLQSASSWDGPYGSADASAEGQFWTAVIPGDDAMVELRVPADAAFEPELAIGQVGHDYVGFSGVVRDLLGSEKAAGACNNDVVCPEADPWRDEIRAVGAYSLSGHMVCSGTLVNSHDSFHPPHFLTANHCGITPTNAQSMVVYWNYQSPTCGAHGGGSLAQHQSGAVKEASYSESDFCLVQLAFQPDSSFNVYYAGWDARDVTTPATVVCIHHPGVLEKMISFCNTPLTITSYLQNAIPGDGTHWRITKWDDGTTEGGSSGSGLWDPNHRIVGQLHGGLALCTRPNDPDWFGRLSRSWEGGGTSGSRLKDWLDPAGSQVLFIDGRNWDGGTSLAGDATLDGAINTQDLVAIVNHILETHLIVGQGFLNADRSGDGELSVVDLVAVVNIIVRSQPLARGATGGADVAAGPGSGVAATSGALGLGPASEAVQLEAAFDSVQQAVVFTIKLSSQSAGGAVRTNRGVVPAAISLVLSADAGTFAPGPVPLRFPEGCGWQGLAMAAADGTVRVVLFDPGAGVSMAPRSFSLPVAGDAGSVRWVEGDAADATASALPLMARGFPLQVGPRDEGQKAVRVALAVQPNPARGACTLRFVLPQAGEAAFTLYDPAGRVVLSRSLGRLSAGAGVSELTAQETAALAPGLYFVRLTLDGRPAETARLIIAR